MTKFILRRLLLLIPILLGLTLLIFVFTRLLPGDPAQTILGERATPENMALVRASLGLDLPLSEQYLRYMGGLLQGDLGRSFITNRDVVNDFLQRFPATIELSLAAMFFAVTLGIPLGMFTGQTPRRVARSVGHGRLADRYQHPHLLPGPDAEVVVRHPVPHPARLGSHRPHRLHHPAGHELHGRGHGHRAGLRRIP